jgi:hypothetical protein
MIVTQEEFINPTQAYVSHKTLRAFNFFWLGFIIYTAAYVLFTVMETRLFLNKIQLVGLALMFVGIMGLIQFKFENQYLQVLYFLYTGWLVYTISRGFKFDRVFLFDNLFNAWYGIMPYFVPVVLLFPKNIFYLKKLFNTIVIAGMIFLVYSAIYRGQLLYSGEDLTSQAYMEIFSKTLSIPCGFLLLTYIYQPKGKKLFAFFVVIVALLLALIRGRRAITVMNLSYLMFFYFIYLYVNRIKFTTLVFSLFLISLIAVGGFKFYSANKKGTFSVLTSRINEDTRSAVEICFYDDMQTQDWIIGRGMLGQYYCPGVDEATTENSFTDYRNMIETDYLNIILKGGIVSLALVLLITIPAAIKGIFYSRNILSKAAGIWILFWIMDLYPATVTTFTLNYLIVWICVGICYSRTIRNMPEEDVKSILCGTVEGPAQIK